MKIKKYISLSASELFIGVLILTGILVLIGGSRLSRLTNSKAISSEKPVDIYLSQPVSLKQLSKILADSGVVEGREELRWAGRLLGWRTFLPGHYQIDGNYSYDVVLSRMARGIQDPISVTIIPGLSKERLVKKVAEKFKFDTAAFHQTFTDSLFLSEIQIDRKQLLGRIFPDTYSLYWTTPPKAVIKRFLKEFENAVIEPYQKRFEELDKSVNEIVTLASIIEWEASGDDEKDKISGLYWNRLNMGMPLQADPTINYAVNERRRLLYEDYRVDHPYNTYMYKGLPPGPITNPSLTSIKAALYPEEHDYLYMVASPEGDHVFSETFAEHKKESAKWREWLRKQYRIKRQKELEKEQEVNS